MQTELLVDAKNAVGESPLWHATEQALYWVDIPAKALHQLKPGLGVKTWHASEMIGCIAMHASGGFIAGMESGVFHLQPQANGSMYEAKLASIEHAAQGMRFNDGRCDRQGRFLAGTMLMNMPDSRQEGCVVCYENKSDLRPMMRGLFTPNGMAFSPDGQTMYLSDSHPNSQLIWAFDYDTASGTPFNQRVFVDMTHLPGRPDGAALDTDGCYWICGNDAGLVHRFTPDGKLDQSLAVPVKKPSMCSFGGADMKTLYVTSIRPANMDLSDQHLAGGVFALRPGAQGIPEPVFQPALL
ncbi:SMP-30/gluconolactonase/LRE family protein [Variovorax sp. PCZ-1]|uniref:SMP-30/gluconolactonase/LRE family protein n=1 Tax=Variovorax sp. PCZ-1 TaxID=2835533 RepID=UPI001BCCDB24|nr:SMP-30/gluconolactonase/LRE family protein [Variovorax sp. PCZ-1]MBS7807853.1 SMP-30/gluconolactonase/LRE family protein [Variovorax sp. PCZ-1]